MKIGFRVMGTLEVPDDIILHEDVLNTIGILEQTINNYGLETRKKC